MASQVLWSAREADRGVFRRFEAEEASGMMQVGVHNVALPLRLNQLSYPLPVDPIFVVELHELVEVSKGQSAVAITFIDELGVPEILQDLMVRRKHFGPPPVYVDAASGVPRRLRRD